jgi:hypothetical protein
MNHGYLCKGLCNISLDEESNVDATRFLELLIYSNEPLYDGCITHNQLLVIAPVFTFMSYYKFSMIALLNELKACYLKKI